MEWYDRGTEAKRIIRKQAGRNSAILLGIFAMTILLTILLLFPARQIAPYCSRETVEILNTLCSHLPFYISALILFKVSRGKNGFKIREFLQKPQLPAGQIAALMVIAIGASHAANLATAYAQQIFQMIFQFPIYQASTVSLESPAVMAIQMISLCLITPFLEELLFRGAILSDTLPCGAAFAVVASALSFGLYHMSIAIPFATVMGLLSGYLTVRCRSLLPGIGIHAIINTYALLSNTLSQYFSGREIESLGAYIGAECLFLLQILMLLTIPAGFILAAVFRKKLFSSLPNGCQIFSGERKQLIYWSHPASIGFLLLVAVMILLPFLSFF